MLKAHVQFLQSEYSNLVVRSNFKEETSRLFRNLETNSTAFNYQWWWYHHNSGIKAQGLWGPLDSRQSSNFRELSAVLNCLVSFLPILKTRKSSNLVRQCDNVCLYQFPGRKKSGPRPNSEKHIGHCRSTQHTAISKTAEGDRQGSTRSVK